MRLKKVKDAERSFAALRMTAHRSKCAEFVSARAGAGLRPAPAEARQRMEAVSIAKAGRGSDNTSRMPAADAVIVILAAGKGTRMRSDLAKVLHRAGGRPLLEHVIRACHPLKAAQLLAVVGHQAEEVGALAESLGAEFRVREYAEMG